MKINIVIIIASSILLLTLLTIVIRWKSLCEDKRTKEAKRKVLLGGVSFICAEIITSLIAILIGTICNPYLDNSNNNIPTTIQAGKNENYIEEPTHNTNTETKEDIFNEVVATTTDNISNTTTTTTTTKPAEIFTLDVSYIEIPYSITDKNAEIRATTNFNAEKVVILCEANGQEYGSWNMTTNDSKNWFFDACFYKKNTYLITITAYTQDGNSISKTMEIAYPFQ